MMTILDLYQPIIETVKYKHLDNHKQNLKISLVKYYKEG